MMIAMESVLGKTCEIIFGGISGGDDHDRESVKKTNPSMGAMKPRVLSGQVNQ